MPAIPATEYIRGFSFYVCFGSYAGFAARWNHTAAVLTLGWMSVGVVKQDIENVMSIARHLMNEAEKDADGRLIIDLTDE